jgi:hypothetical protein
MKFSDSQFLEVVKILQSVSPTPRRNDQRRAPRADIRLPVDLKMESGNDDPWQKAELRNISPRGIRLESTQSMPIGASFQLRFPTKPGFKAFVPLICAVIYCKPSRSEDSFTIGAEFTGAADSTSTQDISDAEAERIRKSILG